MAKEKILWVVNYDQLSAFLTQAVAIGATGVAIRTDNDIAGAIPRFHQKGIKVFGWRWPSAMRDAAMKEANKVVGLYQQGMDGYYVDPEGQPGKPYDWDVAGLDVLAKDFCSTILAAGPNKPLGVTSHYRASATFPKLPWKTFFNYCTLLLPQAYWRSSEGVIGHGIPADNYVRSIDFWKKSGGDPARIVPMAGELASARAPEIAAYAAQAAKSGVDALHFYTFEGGVSAAVWNAVKAA